MGGGASRRLRESEGYKQAAVGEGGEGGTEGAESESEGNKQAAHPSMSSSSPSSSSTTSSYQLDTPPTPLSLALQPTPLPRSSLSSRVPPTSDVAFLRHLMSSEEGLLHLPCVVRPCCPLSLPPLAPSGSASPLPAPAPFASKAAAASHHRMHLAHVHAVTPAREARLHVHGT